ncbi:MAG TPA: MoaD/ThiS family protein [Acidimicrobiales bacterium]
MAKLILLGPAHDAAGTREDFFDGDTLDAVLNEAVERYGPAFEELLDVSQVWLNGEPASRSTPLDVHDEVTVLPPVSGG